MERPKNSRRKEKLDERAKIFARVPHTIYDALETLQTIWTPGDTMKKDFILMELIRAEFRRRGLADPLTGERSAPSAHAPAPTPVQAPVPAVPKGLGAARPRTPPTPPPARAPKAAAGASWVDKVLAAEIDGHKAVHAIHAPGDRIPERPSSEITQHLWDRVELDPSALTQEQRNTVLNAWHLGWNRGREELAVKPQQKGKRTR